MDMQEAEKMIKKSETDEFWIDQIVQWSKTVERCNDNYFEALNGLAQRLGLPVHDTALVDIYREVERLVARERKFKTFRQGAGPSTPDETDWHRFLEDLDK